MIGLMMAWFVASKLCRGLGA